MLWWVARLPAQCRTGGWSGWMARGTALAARATLRPEERNSLTCRVDKPIAGICGLAFHNFVQNIVAALSPIPQHLRSFARRHIPVSSGSLCLVMDRHSTGVSFLRPCTDLDSPTFLGHSRRIRLYPFPSRWFLHQVSLKPAQLNTRRPRPEGPAIGGLLLSLGGQDPVQRMILSNTWTPINYTCTNLGHEPRSRISWPGTTCGRLPDY